MFQFMNLKSTIFIANEFDKIYKAIIGVIFGAIVMGQNASFVPNYAEAMSAADRLFQLFFRNSLISPFSELGIFYTPRFQ